MNARDLYKSMVREADSEADKEAEKSQREGNESCCAAAVKTLSPSLGPSLVDSVDFDCHVEHKENDGRVEFRNKGIITDSRLLEMSATFGRASSEDMNSAIKASRAKENNSDATQFNKERNVLSKVDGDEVVDKTPVSSKEVKRQSSRKSRKSNTKEKASKSSMIGADKENVQEDKVARNFFTNKEDYNPSEFCKDTREEEKQLVFAPKNANFKHNNIDLKKYQFMERRQATKKYVRF